MFGFIKKVFIGLLSFSETLATKCMPLKMNHVCLDLLLLI